MRLFGKLRGDEPVTSTELEPWTITYHGRPSDRFGRLWHNPCVKHIDLPDVRDETLRRYKRAHVCGPLFSRWDTGEKES